MITPPNGTTRTACDASRYYLAHGVYTVPVESLGKRPWDFATNRLRDAWDRLRVQESEIDSLFPEASNIGLLLGEPSGGLVDVDLDTPEARRAAPHLLPRTEMIGGRESAPDSHYFYIVDHPPAKASDAPKDPIAKQKLLELRSTGGQTLVAPSVYGPDPESGHPKPERFIWKTHGSPSQVSIEKLTIAVRAVAAAAMLGRYWPKSSRHDAAMAVAGALRRVGWLEEPTVKFVTAICAVANDSEVSNRLGCVRDTFAKDREEKTTGWPRLAELLGADGEVIVRTITNWLGFDPRRNPQPKLGDGQVSHTSHVTQERYEPLPDYVPFPTDCLPPPWNHFVCEGATALKCDEGLVALPLLSVLAGAVGNSRRVHLGAEWFEPAVFWSCVVAESGGRKSPAAELSVDLVQDRQRVLIKDFKAQVRQYKQEMREHQRASRAGEDVGDTPEEPVLRRVLAGDTTIEKLVGLLDDNPRGLLVYRDELAGWINSFTRYKGTAGGSDESNWLSMHRAGPVIYDRKTGAKTTVFVPNAAISVCGGIQPGTLKRLMTANFFESGLVARILFVMPPRAPKVWSDACISEATRTAAVQSLDDLFNLKAEVDADGDPRPLVLRLTPDSQRIMKTFVNKWGVKQFEAEGAQAAALAKLEALPGRFALIHHVVKFAASPDDTRPIGVESVDAGIRLAEWAARETERVYAMLAETQQNKEIRQLVERVRRVADKNEGRATVRMMQRANQRKYRTTDSAKADLEKLVGLGLGEWKENGAYFILTSRSCVTCDVCDNPPPDEDEPPLGGMCDIPPCPPEGPPTGSSRPASENPTKTSGYAETGGSGEPSVSHVSHVTQDREEEKPSVARAVAPSGECDHDREPVVTRTPDLITTVEGVQLLASVMVEWTGPVGLDTETTGLDPTRDRVRLLQTAVENDTTVIDLFALPDPTADLAPLFAALTGKEIVGHNLQFDLRMLAPLGFVPGRVFDTMLASRVLHAGEREDGNARVPHGLEDVVERELGRTLDKSEQRSDWSGDLTSEQLQYAANDAAVLVPLATRLKAKLVTTNLTETAAVEMRALPGVAWAVPVGVDAKAWVAIAEATEAEGVRLAEEMDCLAPNPEGLPGMETRNWNSTAEVKEAFAQLGIQIDATDDDTLAGVNHPLAGLLRDYRAAAKRTGTYGRKWIDNHAPNGRVLPSWNQLGAESGRMSCSDPNLQQIPRGSDYRRCFVARRGCVLVKADYSQVELRIAAKVANETVMINAYRAGRDLHTLTAARVLNKPEAEVTKADRQLAKAVNFGLLYGMGWKGLKQYAKANYGVELADREAQSYRTAFFKTYPALQSWHTKTESHVRKLFNSDPDGTHEVRTLGGRRRVLRVAKRDSQGKPYPNKTDSLNTPVQGTGADGLKAAIALLWERQSDCPDAVPVIFCHDEIVLEVPEADASAAAEWLRRCMVDAVAPLIEPVPVEVEVTVGRTWAGSDKPATQPVRAAA